MVQIILGVYDTTHLLLYKDFISHMVQIIRSGTQSTIALLGNFISHMVQIIRICPPAKYNCAIKILYIPHGSDNTNQAEHQAQA